MARSTQATAVFPWGSGVGASWRLRPLWGKLTHEPQKACAAAGTDPLSVDPLWLGGFLARFGRAWFRWTVELKEQTGAGGAFALGRMPQTEVPDLVQALGQDMLEEAAHELQACDAAGVPAVGFALLVTEGDSLMAERGLRGVAVGRRNWTFAGSDEGARRAAHVFTLVETCKLNDVDPQAWLVHVLAKLPDHPAKQIAELLPWNWKSSQKPAIDAAAARAIPAANTGWIHFIVQTDSDADALMARVRESADYVQEWLIAQTGEPLAKSRAMKFETVGFHPINHHSINVVEQINQTWTSTPAHAAAPQLFACAPTHAACPWRARGAPARHHERTRSAHWRGGVRDCMAAKQRQAGKELRQAERPT